MKPLIETHEVIKVWANQNIVNIADLLGKTFSDPLVQRTLDFFEFDKKQPKIPKGESDVGIESLGKGIDINFSSIESIDFLDQVDLPEGTLLVTAVFLHNDGIQGHEAFSYPLPHGFTFNNTRDAIRKTLGKPSWSSPILPIDRWVFGRYKVVVDFSEDQKQIDTMTLQLIAP